MRRAVLCLLASAAAAVPAHTLDAPVTVSPGSPEGFAVVDRSCPTFSWGARDGVASFELIVFELPADLGAVTTDKLAAVVEGLDPVLRRRLPGSSRSWTPSASQGLRPGERFVWFVRAEDERGESDWSVGALFEVGAEPTVDEVRAALEVLERYLAQRGGAVAPARDAARLLDQVAVGAPVTPAVAAAPPGAPQPSAVLTPSATGLRSEPVETAGQVFGVHGISNALGGESAGVAGEATGSGLTYGVWGRNDSTGDASAGVYGQSASLSGKVYGVYGVSSSLTSATAGVHGLALGTLNQPYGVYGKAIAGSGRGVFGEVTAMTGFNYGVYGLTASSAGRGVYGSASNGSGSNYGVYGITQSEAGTGVYGKADSSSGSNRGVWAVTDSATGVALVADNTSDGDPGLDLVLAGPEGKLSTDPADADSDLIIVSNKDVEFRLNNDGGGLSSQAFAVRFNGVLMLDMDEAGDLDVTGRIQTPRVTLTPQATPPACIPGTLYYDDSNAFCMCVSAGWANLAGTGTCV